MSARKLGWAGIAVFLMLAMCVPATAREDEAAISRVQKVKELQGHDIKDESGKDIGDVKGLVMAPDEGRIAFVVLKHKDFGKGLLIAPLSVLNVRLTEPDSDGARKIEMVGLAMTKDELERAPSLAGDEWEKGLTLDLDKRVREHYKVSGTSAGGLIPCNAVIGAKVRTKGEDVGDIGNLVVDLQDGTVLYAIVAADGKHRAVPWKALGARDKDGYRLGISNDEFKSTPAYDEKRCRDAVWIGGLYDAYDLPHEGLLAPGGSLRR